MIKICYNFEKEAYMFHANCYNVMIVSPSDVSREREIVKNVLYRWNEINSRSRHIVFSVLGYDINAHPDSGNHPQELLNQQLLEHADLIIAIFWTKLGSPTMEYSSGSVEEISKHIHQKKKAYIYFSNKAVELKNVNMTQYEKLQQYKTSIQGNSYYKEFSTEEDFEHQLSDNIQLIANELEQAMKEYGDQQTQIQEIHLSKCEELMLKMVRLNFDELKITANGKRTFFNNIYEPDKRKVAEKKEAIKGLEDKGIIESTDNTRNKFQLTAKGYRVYDQLVKK